MNQYFNIFLYFTFIILLLIVVFLSNNKERLFKRLLFNLLISVVILLVINYSTNFLNTKFGINIDIPINIITLLILTIHPLFFTVFLIACSVLIW